MAISQLKVKVGGKGKGLPHSNYIMRLNENADKLGKHANGIDYEVEHTSHGNMPNWIDDNPAFFWKMADEHERENGTTYREHIISLPRELNLEQRIELTEKWIKQELGDKHAYQYAMHNPPALDGGEQPHVHLMYSERLNDGIERSPDRYFKRYNSKYPDRGGAKKSSEAQSWTKRKSLLKETRQRWELTCNEYLQEKGLDVSIDMRNWRERGLNEKPENITMKDMQNPVIKQAYIDKLEARKQLEVGLLDIEHYGMIAEYEREAEIEEQQRKAKIEAERQATAKANAEKLRVEQKEAERLQSLEYARLAQIEEQRREQERQARLQAERQLAEQRQPLYEIVKNCFKRIQSGGSYKLALDELAKGYDKYLPKCQDQSQPQQGKGYQVGFGDDFKLMSDGRLGVKNQFGDQRYIFYRASDVIEISDKKRDRLNQVSANFEIKGSGEKFNTRSRVAWADSVIGTIERSGSEKYAPAMYDTPTPFSHQLQTNDKSMERRNDDYGLGF